MNGYDFCYVDDVYNKDIYELGYLPLPSKSECCPPGGKCKTFDKITGETSCSKEYDDNIALTMCPFVKNYCGDKKEFIFKDHRMAKGGS